MSAPQSFIPPQGLEIEEKLLLEYGKIHNFQFHLTHFILI